MSSPRTPGSDAFERQRPERQRPEDQHPGGRGLEGQDLEGQPSEEEMRAYVEELRAADPAGIVVQAYQVLGTGAEVKLGLADARLLIDAMAALVTAVEQRVDPQLAQQMKAGVGQLQNAQVQVEAELREQATAPGDTGGGQAPSGAGAAPGAADGSTQPPGQPGQPQPAAPGEQQMTDRLWIPGRDQGPPRP